MEQLTQTKFKKGGVEYSNISSPAPNGGNKQVEHLKENNGKLEYSVNGVYKEIKSGTKVTTNGVEQETWETSSKQNKLVEGNNITINQDTNTISANIDISNKIDKIEAPNILYSNNNNSEPSYENFSSDKIADTIVKRTSANTIKSSKSIENDDVVIHEELPIIDSALSDTSTNSVQNKVINEALKDKISNKGDVTINGNLNANIVSSTLLKTSSADFVNDDVYDIVVLKNNIISKETSEKLAKKIGVPLEYLVNAVVSGETLTITKADGSTVTFKGGGGVPPNMVTTDTEQTISGNKTFTGTILVPNVTLP